MYIFKDIYYEYKMASFINIVVHISKQKLKHHIAQICKYVQMFWNLHAVTCQNIIANILL